MERTVTLHNTTVAVAVAVTVTVTSNQGKHSLCTVTSGPESTRNSLALSCSESNLKLLKPPTGTCLTVESSDSDSSPPQAHCRHEHLGGRCRTCADDECPPVLVARCQLRRQSLVRQSAKVEVYPVSISMVVTPGNTENRAVQVRSHETSSR